MDNFKNFAKVTVSTGYDASATSIALTTGHGVKFPAPPFNATWWNSTDYPDPSDDPNVEIVRVTAIVTDTLTVTRAQESISASTKNASGKTYRMVAGLTAKTFNPDISVLLALVANGRLTLESGVAISTTDQTAKTSIYFTPYQGNRIGLYDGSMWQAYSFSELTLALGTLTAGKNYDVFLYSNAGTLTLELGAAWTSDTARADALVLQDGVYVKSGATTRRYIGTLRTVTTTTTEDSLTKRYVWNNQNRTQRDTYVADIGSHVYNGTYRIFNNNAGNAFSYVAGFAENSVLAGITVALSGPASVYTKAGLGFDSDIATYRNLEIYLFPGGAAGAAIQISSGTVIGPQLGYHRVGLIEASALGEAGYGNGFLYGQVFA
jgi:hypothetical protein